MATTTTTTTRRFLPRTYSKSEARSAALPPSSSASSSKKGALFVTVVTTKTHSTIQPMSVSLQVAGATVHTGPPSARHLSGTLFRFDECISVNAPLATLFKSKALVTIEYPNPNDNLTAILDCKKLCIQETTSLTLKLKRVVPPEVTTSIASSFSGSSDDDETQSPSISLYVRLEGPMRTEVTALLNLAKAWFHVVDTAESAAMPLLQNLPSYKYLSLLLIPSVPLLTGILVVSPILVGLSILFFPIVLPFMILGGMFVAFWTTVIGFVLASTRQGRLKLYSTTLESPIYFILKQPPAQVMIYDTGSRPTPVTLVQSYLPTDMMYKLAMSIFMDTLGSCSYLLPGLGESFDVIWCPCQTLLIKAMYGTVAPNLTYISFAEEFLPFTDILPSATLGWMSEFGPSLVKIAQQEWKNGDGLWKKYSGGGSGEDSSGSVKIAMATNGGSVRSS